ncbi:hypothetical protein amrb99_55140 [Actinomadura sp. RB99]|nr:hypothetical protein [Actinomadura sp. RB99]
MRQPRLLAAAVRADLDQAARLRVLDRRRVGQPRQQRHAERLPERQRVQDVALRRGEPPHPGPDQVRQAGRQRGPGPPPPHPVHLAQPAGVQLTVDQVPQVERVPLGDRPQPRRVPAVHGTAEDRLQQPRRPRRGERPQLQPGQVPVLPQRGDHVRSRLPGAQREHAPRRAPLHQLLDDERRQVVQQMGVVDADDRAARARTRQDVRRPAHQLRGIAAGLAEQGGERAERERPRGVRRGGPADGGTAPLRRRQGLAREPRLADAGRARHHHSGGPFARLQNAGDVPQFLIAPGERPPAPHRRDSTHASRRGAPWTLTGFGRSRPAGACDGPIRPEDE